MDKGKFPHTLSYCRIADSSSGSVAWATRPPPLRRPAIPSGRSGSNPRQGQEAGVNSRKNWNKRGRKPVEPAMLRVEGPPLRLHQRTPILRWCLAIGTILSFRLTDRDDESEAFLSGQVSRCPTTALVHAGKFTGETSTALDLDVVLIFSDRQKRRQLAQPERS